MHLLEVNPLYNLEIKSPKLTLRLAKEDEIINLFTKAYNNILDKNNYYYLISNWAVQDKETIVKRGYDYLMSTRISFNKTGTLLLTAFHDNEPIGNIDLRLDIIKGSNLEDKLNILSTGSWVLKDLQGQGYGCEMRRLALEFSFNYLKVLEVRSDYIDENIASAKVSKKLGYIYNGEVYYKAQDNKLHKTILVRLDKNDWITQTDIEIINFDNKVKSYFNI